MGINIVKEISSGRKYYKMKTKYMASFLFVVFSGLNLLGAEPEANKLDDNYNKLSAIKTEKNSEKIKAFINEHYDINKKEVSEFLVERLNYEQTQNSEKKDGTTLMSCINFIYPEKGMTWILDNYSSLNALGRVNAAKSLEFADEYYEACQILIILLDDKSWYPRSGKSTNFKFIRTCDKAYLTLNKILMKNNIVYPHTRVYSSAGPEDLIQKKYKLIKDWWIKNSATEQKKLRKAFSDQETFQKKCETLKDYIKQNPVKPYEYTDEEKALRKEFEEKLNKIENMTEEEYKAYLEEQEQVRNQKQRQK